jgi:hypothetical protein
VLDGDFAVVSDGGPDGDGLAGDVAASVKANSASDWTGCHTGQPDLVLDLAVKRLLEKNEGRVQVDKRFWRSFYVDIVNCAI